MEYRDRRNSSLTAKRPDDDAGVSRLLESSIVLARNPCEHRRIFHFCFSKIQPFKWEWLRVCRLKSENLKFIEDGARFLVQPFFGLSGFLNWVFVSPPIGWPTLAALERNVFLSKVDPNECDTNRISAA